MADGVGDGFFEGEFDGEYGRLVIVQLGQQGEQAVLNRLGGLAIRNRARYT